MKNKLSQYIGVLTLIFIFGLFIKWDYVGTIADGHHQFGSALTKLTIENWIKDGITENNFIRVLIPKSIDLQNFYERGLYISYPIGTDLIIYFLKLIFNNIETFKIIHLVSAFFHYLIIIFIFIFISKSNFKLGNNIKNYFAFFSAVSYIFIPLPFYYHLMLFSFDQAVILPFIIILLLEFLIRNKINQNYLWIQSIIFFLSGFFDYFPIILGFSIFLSRIIFPVRNLNLIKNFFQIILPVSIPFFIHIYNLYQNDLLLDLINRFTKRTGISYIANESSDKKVYNSFIFHFWIKKFHIYLPLLIYSIYFLVKTFYKSKFKNHTYQVMIIGFFSSILYSLIFSDFAAIHDFSTLKFYPLLSITLFALIPMKIIETYRSKIYFKFLKKNLSKKIKYLCLIFLILVVTADNSIRLIYYSKINKVENYVFYNKNFFKNLIFSQFPLPEVKNKNLLNKISEISNFNDVYISLTDFEVKFLPPVNLSISKKIVTKIKHKKELLEKINLMPEQANIKVIINEIDDCKKYFSNYKKIYIDKKIIIYLNKKDLENINKCL